MNWLEKLIGILAFVAVVMMGVFGFLVYDTKQEYKAVHTELMSAKTTIGVLTKSLTAETTKRKKALTQLKELQTLSTQKLTEKLEIVEESIDPKDARWAKVKQVREAIKKTIEEFNYPKVMTTHDITRYSGAVVDWSEQYGVSIPLVLAMTRRESAFNPKAKSHAGAIGLIQIMPATAREIAGDLGVHHFSMYKINDNVRFGVYYIMKMMDEFEGDINLAVRAYNCGPTYTRKVVSGEYRDFPSETKEYARKILGDEETVGFVKYYEDMGL